MSEWRDNIFWDKKNTNKIDKNAKDTRSCNITFALYLLRFQDNFLTLVESLDTVETSSLRQSSEMKWNL